MKGLYALEIIVFFLCNVCLGDVGIVVYKHEKVLLISKANGHYWTHKVAVNKLVGFCCSLLGYSIVLLYSFRLFAAITDISFNIIIKDNIGIGEIFFQ